MTTSTDTAELQRAIATDLALLAQRVHDVANAQPGASKARRAWKQRAAALAFLSRNTPAEGSLVELRSA